MISRSILITGCSSGIGLHAATALKERGWQVFATARKPEDIARLNELGVVGIQMDITDSASIQQAVQTVLTATSGTLDALFNNAGLLIAGAVDDLSRPLIRQQFETNVFGPMELIQHILPIMRLQGHGRIVQNSSILGIFAMPYYGAYNASKFALEGFSLTLREECRGTGIHVSILNPGPIQSALRSNAHSIFQETIQTKPNSAHGNAYHRLEKAYFASDHSSRKLQQPPSAVMKPLLHALESKNPHIHYFVGWPARLLAILHKFMPERWFAWLISKI